MDRFDKIINFDTVPESAMTLVVIASLAGGYLVINEILDEYPMFFCQNITKKIMLWCIIYIQTKSIYNASFISIMIVLLFPRVFFGKITGPRLKKK